MNFKSVLIVEDEQIISLMLEQMVKKMGHQVLARVTSGESAVTNAKSLKPDVILMDIRLAGEMDGIEAIHQIQKTYNIPVIYTTGNSDKQYCQRIEHTNFIDFLIKPITSAALSNALNCKMKMMA